MTILLGVVSAEYNVTFMTSLNIGMNVSVPAISDDNEFIVFGASDNQTYFYKNNGSGYGLSQNISLASQFCDISPNHTIAACGSGNMAYFFLFNTQFSQSQNLSIDSDTLGWIDISKDATYIMATAMMSIRIFEFNGTDYILEFDDSAFMSTRSYICESNIFVEVNMLGVKLGTKDSPGNWSRSTFISGMTFIGMSNNCDFLTITTSSESTIY